MPNFNNLNIIAACYVDGMDDHESVQSVSVSPLSPRAAQDGDDGDLDDQASARRTQKSLLSPRVAQDGENELGESSLSIGLSSLAIPTRHSKAPLNPHRSFDRDRVQESSSPKLEPIKGALTVSRQENKQRRHLSFFYERDTSRFDDKINFRSLAGRGVDRLPSAIREPLAPTAHKAPEASDFLPILKKR